MHFSTGGNGTVSAVRITYSERNFAFIKIKKMSHLSYTKPKKKSYKKIRINWNKKLPIRCPILTLWSLTQKQHKQSHLSSSSIDNNISRTYFTWFYLFRKKNKCLYFHSYGRSLCKMFPNKEIFTINEHKCRKRKEKELTELFRFGKLLSNGLVKMVRIVFYSNVKNSRSLTNVITIECIPSE